MSVQNLLKTRHKWKSFSKRVAEITVNTTFDYDLTKTLPRKGENGSFFDDALRDSMQTNLDPQYSQFVSKIMNYTNSLEILLFNKEKVIEAIIEFLSLTYEEARAGIKTVMYLVQQLARDLRSEFYPYFKQIFTLLVNIFEPIEPDFIDCFFKCITFMIKFLLKQIVKDLDAVLELFVIQLFTHKKPYTRRLAAETLAFLLRQVPDRTLAFTILLRKCQSYYDSVKHIPPTEEEITYNIPTVRERIVETIAITISQVTKNLNGSLRSYTTELINWCFAEKFEITFEAFLMANKKLAKHVSRGNHHEIVPLLTESLPNIDSSLALNTLAIWTREKGGDLIDNPRMAVKLITLCLNDASNESIADYLNALETITIPENQYNEIADAVIKLITNNYPIDQLEGCIKISSAARAGVLKFYSQNPEYLQSILNYIKWLRPPQSDIPPHLYELIRSELINNRNVFIPIVEYIYNKDIYNDLLALPNKTLEEREVLYTLMGHYDSDKLAEEPPKLFKELAGKIMEERAIRIFSKLINISAEVQASWFNRESPIFKQLLRSVDFNIPCQEVQKTASEILTKFIGTDEPLESLEDEYLVVRCGDLVFNATHDLKSYREGEAAIARLTTDIVKIRNTNMLMNYALGFARQPYVNFRTHAAGLIGQIIKLKPSVYGPKISAEIEQQFTIADSTIFAPTLIQAVINAEYVDETMVNLLIKYSEVRMEDSTEEEDLNEGENNEEQEKKREDIGAKIIAQLITSLTSVSGSDKFADKVDLATSKLLRSTKLEVRKAALTVQFSYHVTKNRSINEQVRKTIQEILEAYSDPKSKVDTLMKLQPFVETLEFEKDFVINTAVSLTIGCYFEYLTEKVRQKHKYHQLASSMLQSLAFLSPSYTRPLIEATFPQDKSQATLRKTPVYVAPVLSRLSNNIYPFSRRIASTLKECMNACANASGHIIKSCVKAITLFIETEVKMGPNFKDEVEWEQASEELSKVQSEFVHSILKSFEIAAVHNFDPLVRAMFAARVRFAGHFADFPELVKMIIAKLHDTSLQTNADICSILAEIVPFVTTELRNLAIESASVSIDDEKLLNRPTFVLAMLDLLSQLRETEPNNAALHDLLIKFIITSQEPQCIDILKGIKWSEDEFKRLCVLIGRPLEQEFRSLFVPLIAESLGIHANSFISINSDDIAVKTVAYRDLQAVGEFNFVFAMQAFADMQINEFDLQNAASGFLTRVINDAPALIEEFILPSIKFHVNKRVARVPVSEIIILLVAITQQLPDLLPTITRLCGMTSFKAIGSSDVGVRSEGLLKFGEEIEASDDWSKEELSTYILPLLCQLAGAQNLAQAMAPVCRRVTATAIDRLLKRLVAKVERAATVQLLVDLCREQAFTAEQVTPTLMRLIQDKETPVRAQLRMMTALLSINTRPEIIHNLINYVTHKALHKKQDIRAIGQEAITALTAHVPKNLFYDFFQALRSQMNDGYGIPLLYVSLSNVIEHAPIVGCFDPFIKVLVSCLLEDIFGKNAQLRIQLSDKVPEAKKCHSFNSFEKLASKIVFNETIRDVIEAIKTCFENLQSKEQERGAKRLINSIATGLLDNETIHADHIVTVAKELLVSSKVEKIEKKKEEDKPKIAYGHMFENDLILEKPVRSSFEAQKTNVASLGKNFLISFFAMKMLAVFFDNNLFIPDEEDREANKEAAEAQINMLDDLLNDIWQFTTATNDNDTMVISMTILQHYASQKIFPTFVKLLPKMLDFIADQLQQMHTATDEFGKKLFALLTTILTNFGEIALPTKFTRALVQFSSDKLDYHDSCEQIFGVLILVVKRRNDIPEIYDVADRAFELIVRATSADVRRLSADFCSIYLTTYKMKPATFEQHLKFALSNLQSSKSAARRSLVYFIRQFISIATEEQLEKYHELIFLYLGVAIANETDDSASKEIGEAISDLLRSNNSTKLASDFDLMLRWASSDGKQTRTGLLLLAVAVPLTNVESALDDLQQLVDARVGADNIKIKLAAIQLHKAIVSTFVESENVKLFSIPQLLSLLSQRETTRIGCELCHWYLSDYESKFTPNADEMESLAKELIRITFDWSGVIQESGLALSSILSRIGEEKLVSLIPDLEKPLQNEPSQNAVILMMRAVVASIDVLESENATPRPYLVYALKFIGKQKDSKVKELKKAATAAISFVRGKVQPDVFSEVWASIVEADEKLKQEKIEQAAADKLLDPESLRERRREAKKLKKIEKRKKKYLEDDMFDGTLHAFGPDGKRIEPVPLPPEFQDKK